MKWSIMSTILELFSHDETEFSVNSQNWNVHFFKLRRVAHNCAGLRIIARVVAHVFPTKISVNYPEAAKSSNKTLIFCNCYHIVQLWSFKHATKGWFYDLESGIPHDLVRDCVVPQDLANSRKQLYPTYMFERSIDPAWTWKSL